VQVELVGARHDLPPVAQVGATEIDMSVTRRHLDLQALDGRPRDLVGQDGAPIEAIVGDRMEVKGLGLERGFEPFELHRSGPGGLLNPPRQLQVG